MKLSKFFATIIFITTLLMLLMCACDNAKNPSNTLNVVITPNISSKPMGTTPPPAIKEDTPPTNAKITVESKAVSVGEEFVLQINFDNAAGWNWSTFEFILHYNPDVISITKVTRTEYTEDMGMFETNLEYSESSIKVAAVTADDITDAGGTLVNIHCTAKSAGTSDITLTALKMYRVVTLVDTGVINSQPIGLDYVKGQVTVG